MAYDLQTVHPQHSVPVSRVKLSSLAGFRALDITGEDFSSVDTVSINEMDSPDVIVLSANRLLAQLPTSLQEVPDVQSVMVVSRTMTLSSSSLLRFRIGNTPHATSGLMRLVQLFTKVLLSDPGSDTFNRGLGGGLLQGIGSNISDAEGAGVRANATLAVNRTAKQIIMVQSRDGTLARDERLLTARVAGVTFSRASASLFISVDVISQAGTSATSNMEL